MRRLYEILSGLNKEKGYDYILIRSKSLILFELEYNDYMRAGYDKATEVCTFFNHVYVFVKRDINYYSKCTAIMNCEDYADVNSIMRIHHNQGSNNIMAVSRFENTLKIIFDRPIRGTLELYPEK